MKHTFLAFAMAASFLVAANVRADYWPTDWFPHPLDRPAEDTPLFTFTLSWDGITWDGETASTTEPVFSYEIVWANMQDKPTDKMVKNNVRFLQQPAWFLVNNPAFDITFLNFQLDVNYMTDMPNSEDGDGNRMDQFYWYWDYFTVAGDLLPTYQGVDYFSTDEQYPSYYYDDDGELIDMYFRVIDFQTDSPFSVEFTFWLAGTGYTDDPDPNAVPEPATMAVFGLGLAGLGFARARRRRK